MATLVIDPITRIEGHLRIEAQIDATGVVTDAYGAGTQFRGIEKILVNRDPREAWMFAQRICGVCTTVHAIASCRAVENALGITIPDNARLLRNIIEGAQYVYDHVMHFYHLHALDWVDVVSALSASPSGAAALGQSSWPNNTTAYMTTVQGPAAEAGEQRAARPVRQRLLGPSGLPALAGGQPAAGGPLPGCSGLPARVRPDPRDPRRQEPPPADLRGGRHGDSAGQDGLQCRQSHDHRHA